MKRKQQFLTAVQILAPGDTFILKAAARVPEESLPVAPGGAALQLVLAMHKLIPCGGHTLFARDSETPQCHRREVRDHGKLSPKHALRIKSANFWLELGDADQALQELKALPSSAGSHPLAVKARIAALRAAKEGQEDTVQE